MTLKRPSTTPRPSESRDNSKYTAAESVAVAARHNRRKTIGTGSERRRKASHGDHFSTHARLSSLAVSLPSFNWPIIKAQATFGSDSESKTTGSSRDTERIA